jgi:hypothetical protein
VLLSFQEEGGLPGVFKKCLCATRRPGERAAGGAQKVLLSYQEKGLPVVLKKCFWSGAVSEGTIEESVVEKVSRDR